MTDDTHQGDTTVPATTTATTPSDTPVHLTELEPRLAAVPGTVSIWCGRLDAVDDDPRYARNEHEAHYAASTMKLAVMAAAFRARDAGTLDLDAEVEVHNEFQSAISTPERPVTYRNANDYDSDPQPWNRLGGAAQLRWLIRRMIVRSSNLATNLVLEQVGIEAAQAIWELVGARTGAVRRGIEDYPARETGVGNQVTAADLAVLLAAIWTGRLAEPESTGQMREILLAQEKVEDVMRGLPPGTPVAHKNGWVTGVQHSAALILPPDAPPFLLVSCATGEFDGPAGRDLIADIARAAWADRHDL